MNKYMMMGMLLVLGLSFAQWSDPYLGYRYNVASCQADVVSGMFSDVLAPPNGHSYCVGQDLAGRIIALRNQMYDSEGSSLSRMFTILISTPTCYSQSGIDWACVARYRSQYLAEQKTYNSLKQEAFALYIEAAGGGLSQQCLSRQQVFSDYLYYWRLMSNCNRAQPQVDTLN